MGSRAPEAVAALVTIATSVAASIPTPVVKAYDGPVATGDPSDAIHVGYDITDPDGGQAVDSTQEWAGLGAKKRDETLAIHSSIYLVNGAADVAAARARGYAILAAVEDTLHADPSMGLPPPTWGGVSAHQLAYPLTEAGIEVWLKFTVTVRTRPS
jgi:hypothetical protein